MKYQVNENCIGCGLCATICPEVFYMTEEGVAAVAETATTPIIEDTAQDAMNSCPAGAIELA